MTSEVGLRQTKLCRCPSYCNINYHLMNYAFLQTNLLKMSGPLIQIKWAPDSSATACAIRVFPVPEGPRRSTPRGGGIPGRIKISQLTINQFGIKGKIIRKGDFVMVDGASTRWCINKSCLSVCLSVLDVYSRGRSRNRARISTPPFQICV